MKRPTEPKPEDCCNSGCNPCIYDVYEKQLRLYESALERGETISLVENAISACEYTAFYVVENVDLNNEHRLIKLKQSNTQNEKQVIWIPGEHFLFKYSSKKLNYTRAYTPLKIHTTKNDDVKYDFAILVKRYCDGKVSNHLCDMKLGDVTLWRGPYGHYKIIPNKFKRIIMIAQGTGIAPFYSIIKQILNNEDDLTKVLLFYCCRDIKTILLRDELYFFKAYWNFSYEVYLSDTAINETYKYREPIHMQKLKFNHLERLKTFSELDQFLLCGSNEFIEHFKKLLIEANIDEERIVTF